MEVVYAGKQPEGPYQVDNSAKCVVNRMVQPISGSRRKSPLTTGFTSVPLADELLTTHKLTLVGTLRKNKREVPPLFLQSRSMENSIVFGFTKDKTLLSYCPKKKKVVLLLSTMHHTDEIDPDSEESRKPYMLTFYNSTKGGVDMVDEYKARYSKFLQTLSKELSRNYLLERLQLENQPHQLKRNIREITGTAEERNPPPSGEDEGLGRCHLCDWKKNHVRNDTDEDCADEDMRGTFSNLNSHQLYADGELVFQSQHEDVLRISDTSQLPTACSVHSDQAVMTTEAQNKECIYCNTGRFGQPRSNTGPVKTPMASSVSLDSRFDNVEALHNEQANADFSVLCELLKDYVALIGAIKEVFHERVKVYQNWQHSQQMLNKKREQKAKLELSGKPDKGNQASVEVVESTVQRQVWTPQVTSTRHHSRGN
ncbi:hypothetical protein ANN_04720 [Periplaneta americana]|uniref:Uncharacterized protein n=1 Tax=Periplaneta americana TaxID=6978 RepID=A0ABQ8TBL3_PERAM|nr:hypothetical protein ANN_04720 [Periplaneta americana]